MCMEKKGGFTLRSEEHSLKGLGEDEFAGFLCYKAACVEAYPLYIELGDRGGNVGF